MEGKAREESEAIITRARAEIEREKDAAVDALRTSAVDLAMAAASKLLQEKLDGDQDRKFVMDFVEGMEDGYAWLVESYGWKNTTIRHFSKSVEEFLEMLGMTLFLVTFLGQVARRGREIVVRFQERI